MPLLTELRSFLMMALGLSVFCRLFMIVTQKLMRTLLLISLVSAVEMLNSLGPAAETNLPVIRPVPRADANSRVAHEQLLEKAKRGGIDVYFVGDSITRRWGATDYPEFLANWRQNFFGWNAADFGWGADTTQNILWRLKNGELDGVRPKVIVLLAGTNNVGNRVRPGGEDAKAADVTNGIKAIVETMREKA